MKLSTSILSPKEQEVLALMSIGKMYREIASIQNIKLDTVKKQAGAIYKKLGVRNKTEALMKWQEQKN